MTTEFCDIAVQKFIENMKSEFETYPVEDRCCIVTPFYYPNFGAIEFFLSEVGDRVLLSDEGETLNMLFVSGITIEKNKDLYKEAKRIASSYGVELSNSDISVISSPSELGTASQNLISAIQAIAFLIYKRRNVEQATFDDEVEKLLISHEVKYDFNYIVRGQANRNKIKFHVNSNKNLLIEPVSAATIQGARSKAKLVAFKWFDIRSVNKKLRFISIVDDRDEKWDSLWSDDEAKNTITTYSDEVIRWTIEQDKLVDLLTHQPK